jgi:hypothetical protein
MTPDSVPSFLNDLVANLLQFVDQTEIRTQTGNNAPFNYRLVPFISASDHTVFLAAGIPAMQFNHWPDNFYHSSADTIEMMDPTETKRIGFVGAAAFYYLAAAGPAESKALAWESAANGAKWISEVARQSIRLMGNDAATIADHHAAAQNKVAWAYQRGKGSVESVTKIANDPGVQTTVKTLAAGLDGVRAAQAAMVDALFKERAAALGVKPVVSALSPRAQELALMIPRKKFKTFSEEARKLTERPAAGGGRGAGAGGGRGGAAAAGPPTGRGAGFLPGLAASEVSGFIDGTRSVLDIYNAVRAEYGHVNTSSNEFKFAYVVSPDYPDIDMEAVATAITNMVTAGSVEIQKVEPKPVTRKKK